MLLPPAVLAALRGLRYNPKTMGSGASGQVRSTHGTLARLVVLLLLLSALGVRLVMLERQDIWWDEARNIDVALHPFMDVAVAPELDIHPPLYFWTLHAWGVAAGLERGMPVEQLAWLARWLSVAFGVVGVALLFRLAQPLGTPGSGVWAAGLGAFSAFWLAESQETRMYTLGFALLAGAAVAWLASLPRGTEEETGTRFPLPTGHGSARLRPLTLFVILSAAAFLTHYNAVFILVAWYVTWMVLAFVSPRRGQAIRVWGVCGIASALLVAPIAPIALRQIPDYANPNLVVPSVGSYLWENWQAYWAGYAFDAAWIGGAGELWLTGAAGILAVGIAVRTVNRPTTHLVMLLAWLIGGLALYYMAVMDRGAFNVRYSSFVTPALYALAGAGLVQLLAWRKVALVAVVLAVALWPRALTADLIDDRFAREDIAGVTAWLTDQAGPDDVILVDQKYPFGFYYARYAIDGQLAHAVGEGAPALYLFVDINTLDEVLTRNVGEARRVFWVQWFESDTDPRRAVSFLLDQAGVRGEKMHFRGYEVDTWTLTPPTQFELGRNMTDWVARFPPAVETVAVSLPDAAVQPGGAVPVVIRWRRVPDGEVTRNLKARVALYGPDGGRMAQRDERLLNDRHLLPAEWSEFDQPLNVYLLRVPEEFAGEQVVVGVLVYDADTLEPLGATDGAGHEIGVEPILGQVRVATGDDGGTAP